MDHVLTLVAAPAVKLEPAFIAEIRQRLDALGAVTDGPDWLAPGIACDVAFGGPDIDQADSAARTALAGQPVDVVAQPRATRRKRLLLADMESTIIRQEMLDELADLLGLRERIATITARAMNGEIEFEAALRERVALLADLPATALDEVYARVELMPGATALVRTMRSSGARCVLVSGGFSHFTALVRDRVGFDLDESNRLEIADGRLTGRVAEPILGRDAKLAALLRHAADCGISLPETLAVGDGANDLPMLQAAGLGVAYHAKPAVAAAVRVRVDHADLTALLYAQGYRQDEFVD